MSDYIPEVGHLVKIKDEPHGGTFRVLNVEADGTFVMERSPRIYSQVIQRFPVVSSTQFVRACEERVGRGYSRGFCGRPVKEGDLCGIHLGAKKRREATDVTRARQREDALEQRLVKEFAIEATRERARTALDHIGLGSYAVRVDEPDMVVVSVSLLEHLIDHIIH